MATNAAIRKARETTIVGLVVIIIGGSTGLGLLRSYLQWHEKSDLYFAIGMFVTSAVAIWALAAKNKGILFILAGFFGILVLLYASM